MIDALSPFAHRAHGVTPSKKQVAGVETQPDRRQLEDLLDLPRSLDVSARLVMEGWLISPCPAAFDGHLNPFGESLPCVGVEAERWISGRLARARPAQVAADVGECRLGPQAVAHAGVVEDIQQRTELAQRRRHPGEVAERQLEKTSREAELASPQARGEVFSVPEIAEGSEVDPGVARAGDLVEHRIPVRNVRQDADRQLEGSVAHRGVGDEDHGRLGHERSVGAVAMAGSDGCSRGWRPRWTATTASHSAMSWRASAPDVVGCLPFVTQSWKWTSSSLKLS